MNAEDIEEDNRQRLLLTLRRSAKAVADDTAFDGNADPRVLAERLIQTGKLILAELEPRHLGD